jgi:hypothetical protein
MVARLQWRQWGSAALRTMVRNMEAAVAVGTMWAALAAHSGQSELGASAVGASSALHHAEEKGKGARAPEERKE